MTPENELLALQAESETGGQESLNSPGTILFTEDIARFYESTLVPLIFEPYAQDLAVRTRALGPKAVLEVACGTGVVTRALAVAVPDTCSITATDLSHAMIAMGERVGTARPVSWRQADVMALPYADDSFDVVTEAMSVLYGDGPIEGRISAVVVTVS